MGVYLTPSQELVLIGVYCLSDENRTCTPKEVKEITKVSATKREISRLAETGLITRRIVGEYFINFDKFVEYFFNYINSLGIYLLEEEKEIIKELLRCPEIKLIIQNAIKNYNVSDNRLSRPIEIIPFTIGTLYYYNFLLREAGEKIRSSIEEMAKKFNVKITDEKKEELKEKIFKSIIQNNFSSNSALSQLMTSGYINNDLNVCYNKIISEHLEYANSIYQKMMTVLQKGSILGRNLYSLLIASNESSKTTLLTYASMVSLVLESMLQGLQKDDKKD